MNLRSRLRGSRLTWNWIGGCIVLSVFFVLFAPYKAEAQLLDSVISDPEEAVRSSIDEDSDSSQTSEAAPSTPATETTDAASGEEAGSSESLAETSLPDVQVELPSVEVSLPSGQAEPSIAEVELPEVEVETPSVEVNIPSAKADAPLVHVDVPEVKVETPIINPDVTLPNPVPTDAAPVTEAPIAEGDIPVVRVETPAAQVDMAGTKAEASKETEPASGGVHTPAAEPAEDIPREQTIELPNEQNQIQPANNATSLSDESIQTSNSDKAADNEWKTPNVSASELNQPNVPVSVEWPPVSKTVPLSTAASSVSLSNSQTPAQQQGGSGSNSGGAHPILQGIWNDSSLYFVSTGSSAKDSYMLKADQWTHAPPGQPPQASSFSQTELASHIQE
ncbi:hypothetical protein ACHHV8_20845 [Paenibacillus sp. TAB 01]|uniref:hypothetical protein n=1 Tax=Paenibacillus sp. TAB 01 TaxID=3368988 RepID=UPI0037510E81